MRQMAQAMLAAQRPVAPPEAVAAVVLAACAEGLAMRTLIIAVTCVALASVADAHHRYTNPPGMGYNGIKVQPPRPHPFSRWGAIAAHCRANGGTLYISAGLRSLRCVLPDGAQYFCRVRKNIATCRWTNFGHPPKVSGTGESSPIDVDNIQSGTAAQGNTNGPAPSGPIKSGCSGGVC
jgi:hypothetical protein